MNIKSSIRTLALAAGLMDGAHAAARAQSSPPRVAVGRDQVLIAPPAGAQQFRAEVFSPGGEPVFDSGFVAGGPASWDMRDTQGQPVPEGVYVVLLSTADAKGKVRKTIEQVIVWRKPVEQPSKAQASAQQGAVADQPTAAAVEDSVGTPGKIAKWTAADTLSDSVITEDASRIGITSMTPTATLHVDAAQPRVSLSDGTDAGTLLQTSGGKGGDANGAATGGKGADIALLAGNGGDAPLGTSGGGGNVTIQAGSPGTGASLGQTGRVLIAPFVGRVGVGTVSPGEKLTVEGNIQITGNGNGLKFSDNTLQTTAGLTGVAHDATLTGDGTGVTPLGVSAPLSLSGSATGAILSVANGGSGPAITTTGAINTSAHYSIGGSRVLSVAGTGNVFAGVGAGANNNGLNNSFFGADAGLNHTSGIHNSFFGRSAGQNNTTGTGNSFFGVSAGSSNTTGQSNSFFGISAGTANTTGGANSFFGWDAGDSITTGSNTTFIGALSDGTASLNNATAIGFRAYVTQNNSLVLGSTNGVNNAVATVKVGIGTPAPQARLHVEQGDIYVGSPGQGIILKSPNGATCVRLRINNGGSLVTSALSCP